MATTDNENLTPGASVRWLDDPHGLPWTVQHAYWPGYRDPQTRARLVGPYGSVACPPVSRLELDNG